MAAESRNKAVSDAEDISETIDQTKSEEATPGKVPDTGDGSYIAPEDAKDEDEDLRVTSEFSSISLGTALSKSAPSGQAEQTEGSSSAAPQANLADSGASELPPSDARIPSKGFFQDEDDDAANFTLEDVDLSPQPSMTEGMRESAQAAPIVAARDGVDDGAAESGAVAEETSPPISVSEITTPTASSQPASMPSLPMPPPGVEPEEFKGLLFYDGMDNVGRPVVVINARAEAMLQAKLRSNAMAYITARLEPIVKQGPYVLIMVACGHQGDTSSKLPALWLIKAYRSLSRPYKKNVKFIVLVRPSAMLRTILLVLRPFLSLKAARKLHKVDSLLDIDTVTGGDVTAESTGARFLREELGVEPGSLLPPVEAQKRAQQLDAEVQLGTF